MNNTPFQALDSDLDVLRDPASEKLYITEEICDYWRETSRWTSRTAIVCFVIIGLVVLSLGYLLTLPFSFPPMMYVFGFIFAFVLFMQAGNLYHYATRIRKAANDSEWGAMETAFSSLSNAYTIYGLFTLLASLVIVAALSYYVIAALPRLLM